MITIVRNEQVQKGPVYEMTGYLLTHSTVVHKCVSNSKDATTKSCNYVTSEFFDIYGRQACN